MSTTLAATVLASLLMGAGPPPREDEARRPAARPTEPAAEVPRFEAGVELITVDAVVIGKDGRPVPDLRREDFEVREDGVVQQIAQFEAIAVAGAPDGAGSTSGTDPGEVPPPSRVFVVVLDELRLTPAQAKAVRSAVTDLLEREARGGDRIVLVFTSDGRLASGLLPAARGALVEALARLEGRFSPFRSPHTVSEHEAVQIVAYGDKALFEAVVGRLMSSEGRFADGAEATALATALVTEAYHQTTRRTRTTLDVLDKVLGILEGTKGRKALILASQGFPHDGTLGGFRDVVGAARRVNAAVYFLDAHGLQRDENWHAAGSGAEELAADTGGFTIRNTNDLSRGLARIAEESSVYYLLGYAPPARRADGKFRRIEVRVNRKGLKVRARKGYYAPN